MKSLKSYLLTTCTLFSLTGPAHAAGALIFYDASGNQTLDPAEPQSTSGLAQLPLIAIYDSLVGLDETGRLLPRLATAWSYNPELTEFTLTLRSGVTFHDGAKFDAAAVAEQVNTASAAEYHSIARSAFLPKACAAHVPRSFPEFDIGIVKAWCQVRIEPRAV